ncbi:RNA-guided endonuclease InsQ/TnpB family protein [Microseira sp. BLCC-F43]|jgi:putative transposase|uniref:RNA-guided endonuclease InsQ/TnpB family protein n=1 Tax=Microseira sp. BLCC-F43 TaxID=3153602 RepID=UPI0035B86C39
MYALKRELKLNNREVSQMRGLAGFKRLVYNFGWYMVQASWEFDGIKASDSRRIDAIKQVFTQVVMKAPENAWMKQYPSTVYQGAFIDLKEAFSRWRQGLADFPKKKTRKKGDSFRVYKTSGVYPEKGKPALPFTNRVVINPGKRIKLPGLKEFRLKERIDFTCSSQTFTVSRMADKWFVSFVLDVDKIPPLMHPMATIGVDLGVKTLATCSDGTVYHLPTATKRAKTKLSKLQWRHRHQVKGSKKLKLRASANARKFYMRLARLHARIANIRRDTTQKMTTDLSRKAKIIRLEDLNVAGMLANHKLASAISDHCFYEIRRQLTYKQSHYGTRVELVDRWYPSSKTCSQCNQVQPMKLSDRVFRCSHCGQVQCRDLNAALNLERAPSDQVRLA